MGIVYPIKKVCLLKELESVKFKIFLEESYAIIFIKNSLQRELQNTKLFVIKFMYAERATKI